MTSHAVSRCFSPASPYATCEGLSQAGVKRNGVDKITLPAPIPVGRFWSFIVYDGQTRSMLESNQKLLGLDSNQRNIKKYADGSVTVWFAPKAPAGQEADWVQTMPGKGWNSLLRLYAPLEPWFDKTWKPGDLERVD